MPVLVIIGSVVVLMISYVHVLITWCPFYSAEEMIKGLSTVSWEKVDVSFHSSRQRFAAHSVIQVSHSLKI